MTDKNKNTEEGNTSTDFLKELREFALVMNEECPEGHRREPGSGRCLPIGSTDHTAFTRSVNVDYGPEWRGEVDKKDAAPKTDTIKQNASSAETAIDASEMDEPESCAAGTTFSFIQRRCVSVEEAELENADEFAMVSDTEYDETEVASGDGKGGHAEITMIDPEGRRDTVNFQCPPNQFFDFKLRECIPLNKDTVLGASASLTEEEKLELARYLYGKVAMTSPDPLDGHTHLATVDSEGNGRTSVAGYGDESHSHDVSDYLVKDYSSKEYKSRHFGHAVPKEVYEYNDGETDAVVGSEETAAPLKSGQRKALPDSAFGVPGKRKFPLDTCARVRNAMARFNQAKGLSSGEKASLRRKILARARACDIEVTNFAKAETQEDFVLVIEQLMQPLREEATAARMEAYASQQSEKASQGPCPPGMEWDAASRRCSKMQGFYDAVKEQANHADIIAIQPEGRRDTINHACPPGKFFDYKNRKCIPLDPSAKEGTQPGDTTKASKNRDLTPQPEGRPARLSVDCPKGQIWNGDRQECIPLDPGQKTKSDEEEAAMPDFIKKMMEKKKGKDGDSKDKKKKGKPDFMKKKSKSEEEESQTTTNGPGNSGGPGCPDGQFMNPVTKKCQPRKGAFKGKSDEETADAIPSNREGLVPPPAGQLNLPSDCPPGTGWDAKNNICRPLDSMDKNRPDGPSPQSPANTASLEDVVENMSLAKLVATLDVIIREDSADNKEKAKVDAKNLPNEAFPPSLVSSTRRSLMHHSPDVTDPYDTGSVDIGRLRNALARVSKIEGYADKAVIDAQEHLMWHARKIVSDYLVKKG
jgi:hypothetical protein